MNGRLHALLIGIDQYIQPRSGAGICYPPLTGAVRDVRRVREFLCGLPVPPVRILELKATTGDGPDPVEPPGEWPTYTKMVGKFRELTAGADPGDQVYIHYSGHGGRTPTLFPAQKGSRDFDESLVPCDITYSEERYLRDVEVAKLVQEMVDKGLFVTVVLDCCHSGGVRRGPRQPVPRGLPVPDGRKRPMDSAVGSREELARFLRTREIRPQGSDTNRHGHIEGWLVEPQGYVLLAACRPQEIAFEYPISAEETQGALTYRLLEALRERSPETTWQEIYDTVFSRVHDQFQKQAPMLFGEKWRTFLGVDPVDPPVVERKFELRVLSVEKDVLVLAAGRSQGVREGMRFAIYPPSMQRIGAGKRAAIVEVIKAGATECRARIVATERSVVRARIDPGGVAVPLNGVAIQRPAVCSVVPGEGPADVEQEAALDRVRRALEQDPSGALRLAGVGEAADFQIAVDERGEYRVADGGGNPLLNLGPPLSMTAVGAESDLLRRLIHLAKFFDLVRNDNDDKGSPLRGKLRLTVLGIESRRRGGVPMQPFAGGTPGQPIELRTDESLVLEIENGSSQALNVVVIDLQPDWGVEQIFPKKRDGEFWTLDPKEKQTIRMHGYLPEGLEERSDIIKIFATIGIPSFLWKELPALYRVAPPPRTTRTVRGASEEETFTASHLTFNEFSGQEWTTARLEVRVRR